MSNGDPESFSSSVSPTSHPQVANFTITIPAQTQVTVNFGTDTSYGRSTAPVKAPPGGGAVSILVAGMLAATKYLLQARIQFRGRQMGTTPPHLSRRALFLPRDFRSCPRRRRRGRRRVPASSS